MPKKIYLPHIHYTLHIKQIGKLPEGLSYAYAYVKRNDKNSCTLYLDQKRKVIHADVAHELIHVMQFICLDRNIDFCTETEHMGYIMHYLLAQLTNCSWDSTK